MGQHDALTGGQVARKEEIRAERGLDLVLLRERVKRIRAREHLERILKQSPKTDFVLYGMAVLNCLTGRAEDALHYLHQAIQVNPANRFQARNDSDFRNLADDPRFTELLYPETGDDAYGSA